MANPVTWFEIIGADSEKLQQFYRDVFKWNLTPPVKEMGNYSMLQDHEPGISGGIGGDNGDGARVSIYIEVDDPQRYLDRAVASGATVMMPVATITPTTTIAIFKDPAGNVTGLTKANPPPPHAAKSSAPSRSARPKAKASAKAARKPAAKATRRTAKKTAKKTTKRRRS